eukprot:m.32464 g.32464  ORF g.32464 m.32464 type:complete len:1064 (-) comp10789_c0_seq1:281-3472(-)
MSAYQKSRQQRPNSQQLPFPQPVQMPMYSMSYPAVPQGVPQGVPQQMHPQMQQQMHGQMPPQSIAYQQFATVQPTVVPPAQFANRMSPAPARLFQLSKQPQQPQLVQQQPLPQTQPQQPQQPAQQPQQQPEAPKQKQMLFRIANKIAESETTDAAVKQETTPAQTPTPTPAPAPAPAPLFKWGGKAQTEEAKSQPDAEEGRQPEVKEEEQKPAEEQPEQQKAEEKQEEPAPSEPPKTEAEYQPEVKPESQAAAEGEQTQDEQAEEEQQEEDEDEDEEELEEEEEPEPELVVEPFNGQYTLAFLLKLRTADRSKQAPEDINDTLRALIAGELSAQPALLPPPQTRANRPPSTGRTGVSSVRNVGGRRRNPMMPPQAPLVSVEIPETSMELKRTENAFKAGALGGTISVIGELRALLGKITLDNFDTILMELLDCADQALREQHDGNTFQQFVELLHDTAIDSEFFSMIYAKLSKELSTAMLSNGKARYPEFRKMLLAICQKDASHDLIALKKQIAEKEAHVKKLSAESPSHPDIPEAAEAEYNLRRKRQKLLGNAVFIAELYNESVIDSAFLKQTVETYWNSKNDASTPPGQLAAPDSVHCICKLIEKAGAKLEKENKAEVDRIMDMLNKCPGVPNKLKFFIMDLNDWRKQNWKKPEDGPRTREEVQAELRAEAKAAQQARRPSSSTPAAGLVEKRDSSKTGLKGISLKRPTSTDTRPKFGRPVASPAPAKEQRIISNRYAALAQPQPEAREPEVEAARDVEKLTRSAKNTIEEYLANKDDNEAINCVKELGEANVDVVAAAVVDEFLGNMKSDARETLHVLLDKLVANKAITVDVIVKTLKEKLAKLDEITMDSPKAPTFLAEVVVTALPTNEIVSLVNDEAVTNLDNPASFVMEILVALKGKKGEAETEKVYRGFSKTLPEMSRVPKMVVSQMDRKGLGFLNKPSFSQVEDISTWAASHTNANDNELVDALNAIYALQKSSQASFESLVAPLSALNVVAVGPGLLRAAGSVFAANDFPKGLLAGFFEAFHSKLGVDAAVFKEWKAKNEEDAEHVAQFFDTLA